MGMSGLGPKIVYFEVDIPEITTSPFLCSILGRLSHGGLLVPVSNEIDTSLFSFQLLVAVAVQWRLR